jgi:hypothetical protein
MWQAPCARAPICDHGPWPFISSNPNPLAIRNNAPTRANHGAWGYGAPLFDHQIEATIQSVVALFHADHIEDDFCWRSLAALVRVKREVKQQLMRHSRAAKRPAQDGEPTNPPWDDMERAGQLLLTWRDCLFDPELVEQAAAAERAAKEALAFSVVVFTSTVNSGLLSRGGRRERRETARSAEEALARAHLDLDLIPPEIIRLSTCSSFC